MRIGVAFNVAQRVIRGSSIDLLSDEESKLVPSLVAQTLASNGCEVFVIPANWDLATECKRCSVDVVLNLAEGFDGTNGFEHLVPTILDAGEIPYTGADAANILLVRDKYFTGLIVKSYGFLMPRSRLYCSNLDPLPSNLNFPLIIKPVAEEASLGISYSSVVTEPRRLREQAESLLSMYEQPVLIEEFISGREISVGVLGNESLETLPLCEFHFDSTDPLARFRSFESKWLEGPEAMSQPVDIPAEMAEKLRKLAMLAHRVLRCRDYSRSDFRITPQGEIYFLEHNYNPAIGPNSHGLSNTFTRMAEFAGFSFSEMLLRIIGLSLRRNRKQRD
jgi:D-alanine-D-alanine ligase